MEAWVIRAPQDQGERHLVLQSWIRSQSHLLYPHERGSGYRAAQHEAMTRILASPEATVRVAEMPGSRTADSPYGTVAGWIATSSWTPPRGPRQLYIHYLWVRACCRRAGVARRLVDATCGGEGRVVLTCTLDEAAKRLWRAKVPGWALARRGLWHEAARLARHTKEQE